MDRLSKDVRGIIDKYIFDYNYSKVKEQYRANWLNDDESDKRAINWSDKWTCFCLGNDAPIVNYRKLDNIRAPEHAYIYKLHGKIRRLISYDLSTRYKYTGFPFIDYTRVELPVSNRTNGSNTRVQ